jgi:flagellar FliJ protein
MSFQFRFATLLQLHRRARDEAGTEVGKANQAIGRINEQTESLIAERTAMLEQASKARIGAVSIDSIMSQGRYDMQLQADMHSLRETRAKLEQELLRRQQRLIEAEAEVKRFERLKENEWKLYRTEQQKREQAEADESAATRFLMEQRKR